MKEFNLNEGQKEASDGIFKFLTSEESCLIITGAAGYGKTHLMGSIIDNTIPTYLETCKMLKTKPKIDTVHMTATTNKAAQQLGIATGRPVSTIFSLLGIVVRVDYKTGKSFLSLKKNAPLIYNAVIFIDEHTYTSRELFPLLFERTVNCKFIFVGDKYQLTAVGEPNCIVDQKGYQTFELTEPMRNKGEPHLMELCNQLREGVRQTSFWDIQEQPGVIDWVRDGSVMQKIIDDMFSKENLDDRILAYTNKQVIAYNNYIRKIRGLPAQFTEGETLVSNEVLTVGVSPFIRIEEDVTIEEYITDTFTKSIGEAELEVKTALVRNQYDEVKEVDIPQNYHHYHSLLKYYARAKDWFTYYSLKEKLPDFRDRTAATIHKSQGSTYNTVIIDLTDVGTCNIPDMVARMLYVAVSRAKSRVILYGNLPSKYGRIIPHGNSIS